MATACDYEELRNKNLEDNKQVLNQLMSDLKGSFPQKIKAPQKKQKRKSAVDDVPVRRNPSRNARYSLGIYDAPITRSRRGSVSSTASSSSSSTTSPSSSPNKLLVRFGFFNKAGRSDLEETDDTCTQSDEDDDEDFSLPKRVHRVIHDSRPAEEITEEDLDMVAVYVSSKKYDSFYGTTCHQCRQKTNDMKTICRSGHCFGVRGQFCGPCLRNRYGEDAKVALKKSIIYCKGGKNSVNKQCVRFDQQIRHEAWICPPCRGICNCSFCRKKNGKSSTGILIHLARENGFMDVNSYLQSFKK